MPFQLDVLTPNPERRRPILAVLDAALQAVDPLGAVCRSVNREDNLLLVQGQQYDLADFGRIFVLGAGKAGIDGKRCPCRHPVVLRAETRRTACRY